MIELFRVYDINKKEWVNDKAYLSANGDLYIASKGVFGTKLKLASDEDYLAHHSSGYIDSNGVVVMEGDIVDTIEQYDLFDRGIVIFHEMTDCFVIICPSKNTFIPMTLETAAVIKVVGNVVDNPDLVPIVELGVEEQENE